MNPTELTITDWQELLTRYRTEHPYTEGKLAMRIENTPFSVARFYGGMTYEGHAYTYFEPRIPGTTEVAWFCVRDDFLRWASTQLKKQKKEAPNGRNQANNLPGL